MFDYLGLIPWLLLVGVLPVVLRPRPVLESYGVDPGRALVSVIVPTWEDGDRIGACMASLLATDHEAIEVLVVDHGSRDGTREIVEALERRAPYRVRLIETGPLPAEWPWRAWACERGYRESRGELLLFTEPGTIHDPELIPRAVAALERERADLVSVLPRLRMEGVRERLVVPHIWLMLALRFPTAGRVNRSRNARGVVASHRFMLFRRSSYEAMGRHAVMEHGALEDLRMAQQLVSSGLRLFLVHGERFLETRVYRRMGATLADWASAVPLASRSTVAPWAAAVVPWMVAVLPALLFVVPLGILALAAFMPALRPSVNWAALATLIGLLFWLVVYAKHRVRPAYAVAFPAGALLTSLIFVRGLVRGR